MAECKAKLDGQFTLPWTIGCKESEMKTSVKYYKEILETNSDSMW